MDQAQSSNNDIKVNQNDDGAIRRIGRTTTTATISRYEEVVTTQLRGSQHSLQELGSHDQSSYDSHRGEPEPESDYPYDDLYYESLPDAVDSSSVQSHLSDDEDDDDEEDGFDVEGIPMPRLSSSTVPFVLEITLPKNGRYGSDDPLFQGVCLGSVVTTSKSSPARSATEEASKEEAPLAPVSWFFPSVLQHLLHMRHQRVSEYRGCFPKGTAHY
jgi:hypothetical protein